MVLYGSNGTGKTVVLFQCFAMQVSSFIVNEQAFEMLVMVGTDSIKEPICGTNRLKHGLKYCGTTDCDGPELLYDLKTKYLDTIDNFKDVQPTTLEKACKGK